jgi:hypothetical protein
MGGLHKNLPAPGHKVSPPLDEANPLLSNSRHPRPRMQSSYHTASQVCMSCEAHRSFGLHLLSQPPLDRQLRPEEEDIHVWDRRGSIPYRPPTEAQGAMNEHPKEYPVDSLPRPQPTNVPSIHPRNDNGDHEGQRRRSPRTVETSMDTNPSGPKQDGSLTTNEDHVVQQSQTKRDVEAQPSGPTGPTEDDPERSHPLSSSRPVSPPSGSRTFRIRRPSKLPEPTSSHELRDPAGRGQLQASHPPPRQSSLLDRISNPSSSTPGMTPPLRDRVSSPGYNWKRGGAAFQAGFHPGPGASLRDRLEDVGDARHSVNVEWDQSYEDAGNGSSRRDKQNRRERPRRGRGQ